MAGITTHLLLLVFHFCTAVISENNITGGEERGCEQRPHLISDGLVRFHSVRHGDRARYECYAGYRLVGDEYVLCQHGEWVGAVPTCSPAYCPHLGTIDNGTIFLVGVIGKYEYKHYVRRVGHRVKIEFQCRNDHHRIGSPAATCIDGKWIPSDKPVCPITRYREPAVFPIIYA